MSASFKRIIPLLNRIVVRKVVPEAKTKSGLILQRPDGLNYGVVLEAGKIKVNLMIFLIKFKILTTH